MTHSSYELLVGQRRWLAPMIVVALVLLASP